MLFEIFFPMFKSMLLLFWGIQPMQHAVSIKRYRKTKQNIIHCDFNINAEI